MEYPLITYDKLEKLPQDQFEAIVLDLLRYCNHTVSATREDIHATMARMDAMDKVGRLIRSTNDLGNKVSS
ncbi:MAG: hypothetical protein AABX96_04395 [Nanoarchaeota archaeon]